MFRSSSVNTLNQHLTPSIRSSSVSAAPGSAASAVAQAELKLVEAHEDLRDQFLNPSRARKDLDKHAVDSELRFPAESGRALGHLLASKIIATQTGDPGDIELSYEQFADVLGMAYESSGDFRRLFHFRIDRDPEPFCHLRSDGPCAGTLECSIDGKASAVLTLNMNAWTPCDRDARFPMYESSTGPNGPTLHTLWPVRAYLDQIVPVLTGLCDEGDASHSDANREYVNLICKAAGYNEPPCTRYVSPHRDTEPRIAPILTEARLPTPPSAYLEPVCIITEIPASASSASVLAVNMDIEPDRSPAGFGVTASTAAYSEVSSADVLRNRGEGGAWSSSASRTLRTDEPLDLSMPKKEQDGYVPISIHEPGTKGLPILAGEQPDDVSQPRASNSPGLRRDSLSGPNASPQKFSDAFLARQRMLSGGLVIVSPTFCEPELPPASSLSVADDRLTTHSGQMQDDAANTSVIGMHAVGIRGTRTFVDVRVQMLDAMRATVTPLLDGAGEIDAPALERLYRQVEETLIDLRPRLSPQVRANLTEMNRSHQGAIIQASFDRLSQIQLNGLVRGQRDMVIHFQLGELAQAELNVPERALLESLAQTHRVCLAHGELDDFLMNRAARDALLDELAHARNTTAPRGPTVFEQAVGWWIELMNRRVATEHIPARAALNLLTERCPVALGGAFAPGLASCASRYPRETRLLVRLMSTIANRLVTAPTGESGFEQVRRALCSARSYSVSGFRHKEKNFYAWLEASRAHNVADVVGHLHAQNLLLPDGTGPSVSRFRLKLFSQSPDQRLVKRLKQSTALTALVPLPAERAVREVAGEMTMTLHDDALLQMDKEMHDRAIANERNKVRVAFEMEMRGTVRDEYLKTFGELSRDARHELQGLALFSHFTEPTGAYRDAYFAASHGVKIRPSDRDIAQFVDEYMRRPEMVSLLNSAVDATTTLGLPPSSGLASVHQQARNALRSATDALKQDADGRAKAKAETAERMQREMRSQISSAMQTVTPAVGNKPAHQQEIQEKVRKSFSVSSAAATRPVSGLGGSSGGASGSELNRVNRMLATAPAVRTEPIRDPVVEALRNAPNVPTHNPSADRSGLGVKLRRDQ